MVENLSTFELAITGSSSPNLYTAYVLNERGERIAEHNFTWKTESAALATELSTLAQNAIAELQTGNKLHYSFGQRLFTAVFSGAVGNLWHRRLASLDEKQSMHVIIRVDPKTARPFLNFPWEYLYEGDHFLALNSRTPLSRLPWDVQHKSLPQLTEPLRLLVHIATPLNLNQSQILNVAREENLMLEALADARRAGRIEVKFTPNGSLEALESALLEFDPHILHFVGHGTFEENTGLLLMETPAGYIDEVTHTQFAEVIKARARSLRLVYLSACQLAIASEDEGYTDLAPYLMEAGIPAVMAMQFSVRDTSAITLTRAFYKALLEGHLLDIALTEARNTLVLENQASAEFAVPVLFLADAACLEVDESSLVLEYGPRDFQLANMNFTQNFVGRSAELHTLQTNLDPRTGRWKAAIIYGLGGIGKTSLAARLAERMSSSFDSVGIIQVAQATTIQTVLDWLGTLLSGSDAGLNHPLISQFLRLKDEQVPIADKAELLITILCSFPLLLIFDNYEKALVQGQVVSHTRQTLPQVADSESELQLSGCKDADLQKLISMLVGGVAGPSRFLFNSRVDFQLPEIEELEKAIGHIALGEMQFRDTVFLMEELSPLSALPVAISIDKQSDGFQKASPWSKRDIYDRLGGHPYALILFAKYACDSSLESLMTNFEPLQKELLDFTQFDRTIDQLPERARTALYKAAIFAEPFPIEGLAFLLDDAQDTATIIQEDVQLLQSLGFLVRVLGTALYSIHSIVRTWIQSKLESDQRHLLLDRAAHFWMNAWQETGEIDTLLRAYRYRVIQGNYQQAAEIAVQIAASPISQGSIEMRLRLLTEGLRTPQISDRKDLRIVLAATNVQMGDYEAAKQQIQAFLEEDSTKLDDGTIQATITPTQLYALMMVQGQIARGQGEYKLATYYFEAALGIAESANYQRGIADGLLELAIVNRYQGEYKLALEYSERALELFQAVGAQDQLLTVYRELAFLQAHLGLWSEAQNTREKFLKLAEDSGYSHDIGDALIAMGEQYLQERRYKEAREAFEKALENFRGIGAREGISSALHYLGMVHQVHTEYEQALECFEEALAIAEAMGDQYGSASTLSQIGILYEFQGNFDLEQNFQERALEIRRRIGDKHGIAICLHGLGNVHRFKEEYEQALTCYEEAIIIKQQLGDPLALGRTLHAASLVYEDLKRHEQAIAYAERALEQQEKAGYQAGIAHVLCTLSSLFEQQGHYVKAVQCAGRAYTILSQFRTDEQMEAGRLLIHLRDRLGKKEFQELLEQTGFYEEVSHVFDEVETWHTWSTKSLSNLIEARRFLGEHPELFDPSTEAAIEKALSSEDNSEEKPPAVVREHMYSLRYLLREARRRGGDLKAICEAYIDTYGAMRVLEQPAWLEEITRQLQVLDREPPLKVFERSVSLLWQAIEFAKGDSSVAPETLADLLNWLMHKYQESPKGDHSLMVEAAISLCEQASQIYTFQRYPRQFGMIQGNLGNLYANRLKGDKKENLARSIAHYKFAGVIFTHDYFPKEWALTQQKLATIYQQENDIRMLQDAADNYLSELLAGATQENSDGRDQEALKRSLEIPAVSFASDTLRLQEAYRSYVAQAKPACALLRAMKLLFLMKTKSMTEQRIRCLAIEVLGETSFQETTNWQAALTDLEREGFIICKGETITIEKEDLFDTVIDDYPADAFFSQCERAEQVFAHLSDEEALLNLATVFLAHRRFEAAIQTCTLIIAIDLRSARAYFIQGTAASELRRFEDAIQALDNSLEIDPTQIDGWMNKGHLLYEMSMYEQALDAFDRALALAGPPGSYGIIWYNKGLALMHLDRYSEALEAYEHALSHPLDETHTVYALHNMGNVFSEEFKLEEAIFYYDEALQLAPRYARLWTSKARALYYLDRYAEALAAAKQAHLLEPDDRLILQIGAMAESEVQRMEEMLAKNSSVLRQNPDDLKAWHAVGVALTNLGQYEQALNTCEQALLRTPEASQMWALKGIVLHSIEKYEQAVASFDQALTLDPQGYIPQRGKERVLRIQAFLEKRRKAGGSEEAGYKHATDRTTEERPDDLEKRASSLVQLGLLARRHGHYLPALQYLVQALALSMDSDSTEDDLALRSIAEIRVTVGETAFTALWREAAGDQPIPKLPAIEQYRNLFLSLVAFIQAPTWSESQRVLEANSDLLEGEAEAIDAFLEELAAIQQGENPRRMVALHQGILKRCREVGTATAFAELRSDQKGVPEDTFLAQLNELCWQVVDALRTNNANKREALVAHLENLTSGNLSQKDLHNFLALLVAWLRGNDIAQQVEHLHAYFQDIYRRMAAEVAHSEQSDDKQEQQTSIIVALLNNFLRADWEQRRHLMTEHAEVLLSERTELVIGALLKVNKDSGVIRMLEDLRALLHRCRVWGIDAAEYLARELNLGSNIDLAAEYEPVIMQIATLLSRQREGEEILVQAVEALQKLLSSLKTDVPDLFKAALLCDLAHTIERLPTNHALRKLDQVEAYYREATRCYMASHEQMRMLFVQYSLGCTLNEQGRYTEALEALQVAIQGWNTNEQYRYDAVMALSTYAGVLDSLGRIEEALAAHNEAIVLGPDLAVLYRNRAETLVHARQLTEAEQDLVHAVDLDGNENSPYLWYRRAQVAVGRGEGLLADQLLDEVVKRAPSFDVALPRAQAAWLQGNLSTSQELLREAWERANTGERAVIRRDMEQLFKEHPSVERGELNNVLVESN